MFCIYLSQQRLTSRRQRFYILTGAKTSSTRQPEQTYGGAQAKEEKNKRRAEEQNKTEKRNKTKTPTPHAPRSKLLTDLGTEAAAIKCKYTTQGYLVKKTYAPGAK